MGIRSVTTTRPWLRAPADFFVAQFADDGAFGGLTQWVRAARPGLDLHLWSDPSAAIHRARVVAGTIGLLDIAWEPDRFRIVARRPFTRAAEGWLDDAWHPLHTAPSRVRRAVGFGEAARAQAASRAAFPVAALAGLEVVTQEYAPVLGVLLEATAGVARVREALLPSPIPGGAPFFSAAPDAVAVGADGILELVRVYGDRAPELRFAAAQALVDLDLHDDLADDEREAQARHLARIAEVRRELGLALPPAPVRDGAVRARVVVAAGRSPRMAEQFEAVRARLAERGPLDGRDLVVSVVPAPGEHPQV